MDQTLGQKEARETALQFSLPVASARSSISILVYCREEFQLFISIFLPIFAVSFLISFLILNDLLTSDNQQIISGTARVHLGCSVNDISQHPSAAASCCPHSSLQRAPSPGKASTFCTQAVLSSLGGKINTCFFPRILREELQK